MTSLNALALKILLSHQNEFERMGISRTRTESGATIYDFGCQRSGTLAGGLLLTDICLAGLGESCLAQTSLGGVTFPAVQVRTDDPVGACLASQYAGWPVSGEAYYAMGSGPGRLLRGREALLTGLGLAESSDVAVVVLESAQLPPDGVLQQMAEECRIEPAQLHLLVARTASLPGLVQIVGRSIETTLHKLFEIGFDVTTVRSAVGWAPLPPIGPNDLTAIGWSNDAILYGAQAFLYVDCDDASIGALHNRLTSDTATDFGQPFLRIFEKYDRDFYKIDKLLFSPAAVVINNLRSGRTVPFGKTHPAILLDSWGLAAT